MIDSQDHRQDLTTETAAVCCGCTCYCDDIRVAIENGLPVFPENICARGSRWFAERHTELVTCRVAGKESSIERAIDVVVELIKAARNPLICGLQHLPTLAQQTAANLAMTCRGTVDSSWSNAGREHMFALQQSGRVTASLGQISQQCDTIVFWNVNPTATHPRLLERHCRSAKQIWIVVSNQPDAAGIQPQCEMPPGDISSDTAGDVLQLAGTKAAQSTALWTMRAIMDELEIDPLRVKELTGIPLDYWRVFVGSLMESSGVAWFVGGLSPIVADDGEATSLAMHQVVRRLNDFTKCYLLPLRSDFNGLSAENVLSWTFGFPFAVNLNRSQPRWNKLEFSAGKLLDEKQVDCVLTVLGDANDLKADQIAMLRQVPTICLHSIDHPLVADAAVSIPIAQLGWDDSGDVSRMDDMTLIANAIIGSNRFSAVDVLQAMAKQLQPALSPSSTSS